MSEGNTVTRPTRSRLSLDDAIRLAEIAYKSCLFPDVKSAAQGVIKILAGDEMGFGALASLASVHVFDGHVDLGAHLRAAAIKRRDEPGVDHYDYGVVERSDTACELVAYERNLTKGGETRKGTSGWQVVGSLRYTLEEAHRKKWHLTQGNKVKLPWEKTPANMLFCRVLSDLYKTFMPDLTAGVLAYDPDELDRPEALDTTATTPAPRLEQIAHQPPTNGEAAHDQEGAGESPAEEPAPPPPVNGQRSTALEMDGETMATLSALTDECGIAPETLAAKLKAKFGEPEWHRLNAGQAHETIAWLSKVKAAKEAKEANAQPADMPAA